MNIMTLVSSFPGAGDVWFSLRNTTYQNNSIVTLEDIGEDDDALVCITNLSACCRRSYTGEMQLTLGTGSSPMEPEFPALERISTETEIIWWYVCTAQEVEWKGSTAVRYLILLALPRPYTLECTQQTLVSGMCTLLFCNHTTGLCWRNVNCDRQHL